MTSSKKNRMSMLDGLASVSAPPPSGAAPMMSNNRALRSARDAVDGHHVWELDPAQVDDDRITDRLGVDDVADLIDAIETNGQTVPILVRRHPSVADRYLLVYGRRRLEAIRRSDKVAKVRALVASLDDDAALRAQISENMARRDLSFIEKALFAQELIEGGFGNQSQVAEVLTVTKSSVSMAISIAQSVGKDLISAIGPAHGIGRPRWETVSRLVDSAPDLRAHLIEIADEVHTQATVAMVVDAPLPPDQDISVQAFMAVEKAVRKLSGDKPATRRAPPARLGQPLLLAGQRAGRVQQTRNGVRVDIETDDPAFSDWIEGQAQSILQELHERWQKRS